MGMSDDLRVGLGQHLSVAGRCLAIRSLVVDGRDEFLEFIEAHGFPKTGDPGEVKFLERLGGILSQVAELGEAISDQYFRRLRSSGGDLWPGQWEIRVKFGRANHRFYGFVERRVLYLVCYRDKQSDKPDPGVLRRVAAVREIWLQRLRAAEVSSNARR